MMIQDGSGQRPVFNAKESFIERAGPYHPRPFLLENQSDIECNERLVLGDEDKASPPAARVARPDPRLSGTRPASLDAQPAEAQEAYRSCSSWEAQYRSRTIDRLLSSARGEHFLLFRRFSHRLVIGQPRNVLGYAAWPSRRTAGFASILIRHTAGHRH
jgi:hypothetical protein